MFGSSQSVLLDPFLLDCACLATPIMCNFFNTSILEILLYISNSFYVYTMKDCTVYKTMNIIGKRWTIHILLELHKGEEKEKRFNELKRKLGYITPKILSERLTELEDEGLITKKVDDLANLPKSEYCLTESGVDFVKIIQAIKRWGLKWKFQNEECEKAICMYCDH